MYPIHCSRCGSATGAYFMDGDPYLPMIICTPCAERAEDERGETE